MTPPALVSTGATALRLRGVWRCLPGKATIGGLVNWILETRSPVDRALIAAAYLTAVVLFLILQEIGLRLRREEHRAWWAGTGRDLLNACGCAAVAGSLWLFGFPAPAALLVGGTLTLVLFGGYVFFATQTEVVRPRLWAAGIGLVVAIPVLLWPAEVLWAADRVVGLLFARTSR
jgi:hypothetical protein